MRLLSQNVTLPGDTGVSGPSEITSRFKDIGAIISKLLPLLYSVAGLILLVMLLWGGFDLLFSGGDQAKMTSAKNRITAAIVGFILIFVAYWLTQLVSFIFGLKSP